MSLSGENSLSQKQIIDQYAKQFQKDIEQSSENNFDDLKSSSKCDAVKSTIKDLINSLQKQKKPISKNKAIVYNKSDQVQDEQQFQDSDGFMMQQSLSYNQPEVKQKSKPVIQNKKIITSASFRNGKKNSTKWNQDDNDLFFQLLSIFGTDFQTIAHYFPSKTANQIKQKFLREETLDIQKVNNHLKKQQEKSSSEIILETPQIKENIKKLNTLYDSFYHEQHQKKNSSVFQNDLEKQILMQQQDTNTNIFKTIGQNIVDIYNDEVRKHNENVQIQEDLNKIL